MDVKPYTAAARLSSFLPLPKALLTADLSGTALLLYALLLDRGTLSAKNGYTGRGGQVYVVYPIQKLAAALGKGESVVKDRLKELEQAGLILRTHPERGRASHIFLYLPEGPFRTGGGVQKDLGEGAKKPPPPGPKEPTNQQRKPTDKNQSSEQGWGEESL
ncbi:replication initiator protein A [Pseudoflavonifractor phocaeensis]|uniref:replication initiator protein A n=1 Tax=Pseudoflavonifractor phocaeensis TaxID=1870988 RepID=UPI00195C2503|nr:replication initiator protein A [Pseudoflavonifractor phocaeensis]MBM6927393.1 replication initiator protein A [Pseudoflavonifractor phocaeensis]